MKIVHITESYGGGVTSAINTYVKNSQQFDHYLFATVRGDDATGEEDCGDFKEIQLAKRSFFALFDLKNFLKDIKPDVIHLHSSFAGAICRLMPYVPKNKTVYTPHAFAFLRDQHPIILKAYYCIESLLAIRTQIIAGCGRDEMLIARKFIKEECTAELINVCDPIVVDKFPEPKSSPPVVAMLGRVSKQKGVDFFAAVASAMEGRARFIWIGGGDFDGENKLKNSGVEVSGWATRREVLSYLGNADVYLHTAAWDGFPISVLEAAELDRPIILRKIGPFSAENLNTVDSVDDAVKELEKYISGDKSAVDRAIKNKRDIKDYHSADNLKLALNNLYTRFR